ncbi:hypothetical protein Phum_PHUM511950 [Pediculus humanus corporis]|uniref:JmjC domain-containing histone demethylation protein 2C n=1 Tax=Pediculus humanus subsp. corporis TaxID=121224 RepID=E0VY96_PEDHC|nr:uncharacterized protein Phum_PHUM511950 [Pediculus humanus corporis]EEB18352.1 hypothetical protein Phum_PHUM511950 [Pediculus humanus corporis]
MTRQDYKDLFRSGGQGEVRQIKGIMKSLRRKGVAEREHRERERGQGVRGKVLVEYDDVEWHRREWISIYKDSVFHLFMVEDDLVWSDRVDPYSSSDSTAFWPALNFVALVDLVNMKTQLQPVEFLVDRELAFRDYTRIEPFLDFNQKFPGSKDHTEVVAAIRRWLEYQDGQRILLTTPSVLVGYRVEVYRAEGTTQWYTAVIVGYNESTKVSFAKIFQKIVKESFAIFKLRHEFRDNL